MRNFALLLLQLLAVAGLVGLCFWAQIGDRMMRGPYHVLRIWKFGDIQPVSGVDVGCDIRSAVDVPSRILVTDSAKNHYRGAPIPIENLGRLDVGGFVGKCVSQRQRGSNLPLLPLRKYAASFRPVVWRLRSNHAEDGISEDKMSMNFQLERRRFSGIPDKDVYLDRLSDSRWLHLARIKVAYQEAVGNHVGALVKLKECSLIFQRLVGIICGACSLNNASFNLMSSRYLLPPLPDGHVSVEDYGQQSQPFHKQPYPIASFLALFVGACFVFCGLWLMHFIDRYLLGTP
jgi:hypothetical protein